MQDIIFDEKEVLRFKENKIVNHLLVLHMDMNEICKKVQEGIYSYDDYYQLLQLAGYSLDGYFSLVSQHMHIEREALSGSDYWEFPQACVKCGCFDNEDKKEPLTFLDVKTKMCPNCYEALN